jgi:hypothetical protein
MKMENEKIPNRSNFVFWNEENESYRNCRIIKDMIPCQTQELRNFPEQFIETRDRAKRTVEQNNIKSQLSSSS